MRPRFRSVGVNGLLRKEGDVSDVEGLKSSQELFFVRLRESLSQSKKDLASFRLRIQSHISDHDLLHVELAHLERDVLKNPW